MTAEEIEFFRRMSPSDKILMGCRLFDEWQERRKALLRSWHPEATDRDILGMIRQHIREEDERENAGIYVTIPPED
jgi:hypothetical protein